MTSVQAKYEDAAGLPRERDERSSVPNQAGINLSRHQVDACDPRRLDRLLGFLPGRNPAANFRHGKTGGEGGIRTHERVAPLAVFKTAALNRSATSPAFEVLSFAPRRNGPCAEQRATPNYVPPEAGAPRVPRSSSAGCRAGGCRAWRSGRRRRTRRNAGTGTGSARSPTSRTPATSSCDGDRRSRASRRSSARSC
jgi:hypothetical protein